MVQKNGQTGVQYKIHSSQPQAQKIPKEFWGIPEVICNIFPFDDLIKFGSQPILKIHAKKGIFCLKIKSLRGTLLVFFPYEAKVTSSAQ